MSDLRSLNPFLDTSVDDDPLFVDIFCVVVVVSKMYFVDATTKYSVITFHRKRPALRNFGPSLHLRRGTGPFSGKARPRLEVAF